MRVGHGTLSSGSEADRYVISRELKDSTFDIRWNRNQHTGALVEREQITCSSHDLLTSSTRCTQCYHKQDTGDRVMAV
jgi:hypothetical protein